MDKQTWVVVANSAAARIFRVDEHHLLQETENLEHNESRLHVRDLTNDLPGRTSDRYPLDSQTSPKDNEVQLFATELSHHLQSAHQQGHFARLYLAASPSFLGLLRPMLSPLQSTIIEEVSKDLTKLRPEEIKKHFPYAH